MRFGARAFFLATTSFLFLLFLDSCGGGGSSSGTPQPTPDFSISVSPNALSLTQNSTTQFTVSITPSGGFNEPLVYVTIAGLPANVFAAPSTNLDITPGTSQTVTLSANTSAPPGPLTITLYGVSNTLKHSVTATLQIVALPSPQTNAVPTKRLRYFDTSSSIFDNSGKLVIYNAPSRHFFFADPQQNQIFVFDAKTEKQLSSIFVPGALSLDQSADGSMLYAVSTPGDIYMIDPVALAITKRVPSSSIGPSGFQAYGIAALADGRFVLLGGSDAVPVALSAFYSFAVWQPSTNTLTKYVTSGAPQSVVGQAACGSLYNIAGIQPNSARTKIFLSNYTGSQTICQFDPATGQSTTSTSAEPAYQGGTAVLPTPDDKNFITFGSGNAVIWDASTMAITDQFSYPTYFGAGSGILSKDGNTLYTAPTGFNAGIILAYNWRTHKQLGWVNEPVAGLNGDLTPLALDETGLIGGTAGGAFSGGFGFADVSSLQTASYLDTLTGLVSSMGGPYSTVQNVGPATGGSAVQFNGSPGGRAPTAMYFDNQPVSQFTAGSDGSVTALSPAHAPGPVDVAVTSAGAVAVAFDTFSYGPYVTAIASTLSTAEGGGTATLIGYGFSQVVGIDAAPPIPQVLVGSQPVPVTDYSENINGEEGIPKQTLQFTIPPGAAGSKESITVTNSFGTTTPATPITYLPAIQSFPLPAAASLAQGVYDPNHQLYYFTDLTQIRVFSRASLSWQTPISLPNPSGGAQELVGIAISPDGSKLAVSDDGTNTIYLLNTSTLTVTNTFALPNSGLDAGNQPCGLAISDAGIVYYATYQLNGGGNNTFHKLDTNTGVVTAYPTEPAFNQYDQYDSHVLISKDNASVFYIGGDTGFLYKVTTATDQGGYVPGVYCSYSDMALSADGTSLGAGGVFFDRSANPQSSIGQALVYTINSQEIPVDGEKFSVDGKLLFLPQEQSIQIVDVATALPVQRLGLPVRLSPHFDSLVSNGSDNVLVAITDPGNGIALIDLSGVPEPSGRPGSVASRKQDAGGRSLPLLAARSQVKNKKVQSRAARRRTVRLLPPIGKAQAADTKPVVRKGMLSPE